MAAVAALAEPQLLQVWGDRRVAEGRGEEEELAKAGEAGGRSSSSCGNPGDEGTAASGSAASGGRSQAEVAGTGSGGGVAEAGPAQHLVEAMRVGSAGMLLTPRGTPGLGPAPSPQRYDGCNNGGDGASSTHSGDLEATAATTLSGTINTDDIIDGSVELSEQEQQLMLMRRAVVAATADPIAEEGAEEEEEADEHSGSGSDSGCGAGASGTSGLVSPRAGAAAAEPLPIGPNSSVASVTQLAPLALLPACPVGPCGALAVATALGVGGGELPAPSPGRGQSPCSRALERLRRPGHHTAASAALPPSPERLQGLLCNAAGLLSCLALTASGCKAICACPGLLPRLAALLQPHRGALSELPPAAAAAATACSGPLRQQLLHLAANLALAHEGAQAVASEGRAGGSSGGGGTLGAAVHALGCAAAGRLAGRGRGSCGSPQAVGTLVAALGALTHMRAAGVPLGLPEGADGPQVRSCAGACLGLPGVAEGRTQRCMDPVTYHHPSHPACRSSLAPPAAWTACAGAANLPHSMTCQPRAAGREPSSLALWVRHHAHPCPCPAAQDLYSLACQALSPELPWAAMVPQDRTRLREAAAQGLEAAVCGFEGVGRDLAQGVTDQLAAALAAGAGAGSSAAEKAAAGAAARALWQVMAAGQVHPDASVAVLLPPVLAVLAGRSSGAPEEALLLGALGVLSCLARSPLQVRASA